jgi:hypothetical protein
MVARKFALIMLYTVPSLYSVSTYRVAILRYLLVIGFELGPQTTSMMFVHLSADAYIFNCKVQKNYCFGQ